MLNFSVGPVQSNENVRTVGYQQIPYFRTPEFSEIMLENEQLVKQFAGASDQSRVVFLTGSGTAAMEATVMNLFSSKDFVLVINGGSFGKRFVDLCHIHGIPCEEICLAPGEPLTNSHFSKLNGAKYTGLLINAHETSTGVLYDMDLVSDFCRRNHILLVVDAISSFLADPFDMKAMGADVMIAGSQKALACPPGISLIVLSEHAVSQVKEKKVRAMYFDLANALKNGERGQTPFTPAVGILLQINTRLKEILSNGGAESEILRTAMLAEDFRNRIVGLPLEIASPRMSNACTPLHPVHVSAYKIFEILKNEYNIWVCPNGGDLADRIFRVGHIGDLTAADNKILVDSLKDMQKRGLL